MNTSILLKQLTATLDVTFLFLTADPSVLLLLLLGDIVNCACSTDLILPSSVFKCSEKESRRELVFFNSKITIWVSVSSRTRVSEG